MFNFWIEVSSVKIVESSDVVLVSTCGVNQLGPGGGVTIAGNLSADGKGAVLFEVQTELLRGGKEHLSPGTVLSRPVGVVCPASVGSLNLPGELAGNCLL